MSDKDIEKASFNAPSPSDYEKQNVLAKMGLLLVVVSNGQEQFIAKTLMDVGCSAFFVTHGRGTAPSDVYEVFGLSRVDKQLIFAPIRERSWLKAKPDLDARFRLSDVSRGLATYFDMTTISGVSTYKFLSDTRVITNNVKGKRGRRKMEELMAKAEQERQEENDNILTIDKDKNFEMIVCIVNNGYSDLVMDAAKKAGAKGGTIFNARGTSHKEVERFFGIVINPEKQVVLILVEKQYRDRIMTAIYQDAGMSSKSQGICFSLAVSDVLGYTKADDIEPSSPTESSEPEDVESDDQ